eukprot:2592054-Rhodomonas_salina.2
MDYSGMSHEPQHESFRCPRTTGNHRSRSHFKTMGCIITEIQSWTQCPISIAITSSICITENTRNDTNLLTRGTSSESQTRLRRVHFAFRREGIPVPGYPRVGSFDEN